MTIEGLVPYLQQIQEIEKLSLESAQVKFFGIPTVSFVVPVGPVIVFAEIPLETFEVLFEIEEVFV